MSSLLVDQNPMDTGPNHQQSPNDIAAGFASMSGPPHPDILPPIMSSHDMPSAYKTDLSSTTNGPIHMTMPDITDPTKISTMECLEPVTPVRTCAPNFIPDFPSVNGFGTRILDNRTTNISSPSGTSSISSNPSHVASPTMHGISPNYCPTSSSLASALDNVGVSPNRSGPSSSTSNFTGPKPEFEFPLAGNMPIHSTHEFLYPSDLGDAPIDKKAEASEASVDAHLLAIGGLLTNISKTAYSAQEACSMGNGVTAGAKIDELKRAIILAADLMAAIGLVDSPPVHNAPPNYSGVSSNVSHSPRDVGSISVGQEHQSLGLPAYSNHPAPSDSNAMDFQCMDINDGCRKRCASSMAGDRAIKTMKIEPSDDTSLQVPSTPAITHLQTSPAYPSILPSNPPSTPASRPSSSAGLPTHHTFNPMLPQQSHSYNFQNLELTSPNSLQHSDFTGLSRCSSTTPTHAGGPSFPSPAEPRMSWSDGTAFTQRQHQHTNSGSSLNGGINLHLGPSPAPMPFTSPGTFGTPPTSQPRSGAGINGVSMSPTTSRPVGRLSRSGSMTGNNVNLFAFSLPDTVPQESYGTSYSRPTTGLSTPQSPVSSPEEDYDFDQDFEAEIADSPSASTVLKGRNDADTGPSSGSRPATSHHNHQLKSQSSGENITSASSNHGNEVPQEYRAEVDRVFFEFLESTCSNLDATDAKGEPIHQTLMAKKMQRLDESPEFRPFKFRIQAFTNAFLEELAQQGYPEEKIPMKKIRNYLWNQPYISRFNEDGKKAKSKGNHIWNINAKKKPEGGWVFSPFHRRLAGTPHGVAYVGIRWTWAPRIWDPQASRTNVPVTFSSPNHPSWLSWKDNQLMGTPPPEAESCDITVEAKFTQDGQEECLTQTVHLNIAPMSTFDTFSASRRPSAAGDISNLRRGSSDTVVPQLSSRSLARAQTSVGQPHVISPSQDTQVLQVLTAAAQRVAQEAQSQVIASRTPSEPTPALELLAKQQHVLTVTAQALDQTLDHGGNGLRLDAAPQPPHVLAMASAAQQVVLQAARTVTADRTALNTSMGIQTPQSTVASQVTVNEVSVATQTAVAQAVGMSGPLSSEVDVLMTASSLLQQQARQTPPVPSSATLDPAQLMAPIDTNRPHSTGTLPPRPAFPIPGNATPSSVTPSFFPPSLSSIPSSEYVQRQNCS